MNLHVLTFLLFAFCAESYKILVFFPVAIKSVNMLGESFVKHLLNAGHEVTFVTAFPVKEKEDKKFRQIDISYNQVMFKQYVDLINLTSILGQDVQVNEVQELQEFGLYVVNMTYGNENVKKLLQDTTEQYDVVIVDLFETELHSGLAALYDCPMIWAYSMGAHWNVLQLIDQPSNPAYTVDYLSTNAPPLTFVERIEELWAQIKSRILKRFVIGPKEEVLYEKIFKPLFELRGKPLPNYEELIYNASLMFSNEYSAFGNIQSTPQNFKLVAGLHIENNVKPLPKDLQSLMDNAKHGVIFFSMGSTWKSKDLPKHLTESLLQVFGEVKQTVIWKYEAELKDLPKNVHIVKWAPQHSILAHPNCLFFITHGGLLSSTEAVHFGVPVIGIPIFFDQFINVNKAVKRGYAIRVDLTFDLPQNLKTAIQMMLTDDRYSRRVQELSLAYHDRVVSPGTEVVHWVEHVVRTRGAPHLRSPALLVPWYQKMYLDLLALILAVAIVLKTAVKRLCCRRKIKNISMKKKKK